MTGVPAAASPGTAAPRTDRPDGSSLASLPRSSSPEQQAMVANFAQRTPDRPPGTGRAWEIRATETAVAADPLEQLARQLLGADSELQRSVDERLQRQGIDPAAVPRLQDRFHLAVPLRHWGSSPPRAALESALRAAAEFVAEHHVRSGGRGSEFFSTVELLPFSVQHDSFKLDVAGDTLKIGLRRDPTTLWTALRAPSSASLERAWEAGEHLDDARLKKMWPLLNPQGEVRATLRKAVAMNVQQLVDDLRAIAASTSVDQWKARLARLLDESAHASAPGAAGLPVLAEAHRVLDGLQSREDLERFVTAFARELHSQSHATGAIAAVQQAVLRRELDVHLKIHAGLVAVGNLHDINVDVAFVQGPDLSSYVVEVPTRRKIDVDVRAGLVAVFTNDLIDVQALGHLMTSTLTGQRVHATAALDRALDEFRVAG